MSQRPAELPPPGAPDVLYIVDISGYVFRAYHALDPLTSPSGEPTHATYGTLNMLTKLLRERKPTHLGVAMEGGRSLRAELDVRYKAHRPAPPADLTVQMQRTREIVEAYRIPTLFAEGYEADDVIATVVKKAKAAGMRVVISSADKDLMQLVDDRCVMWDTMRDRVYGPAEVTTKFGVGPDQLRDLLALVGDTSDNIPGVPGIGPKTAADLIHQFGTLEGVYEHLDEIKRPKLKQSLADNKADALLSQNLVTLREDAPVELDVQALTYDGGDNDKLQALFTELGFTRYLSSLPRGPEKAKPSPVVATYTAILDMPELDAFVAAAKKARVLSIYVHTNAPEAMRADVSGVALACEEGRGLYVPIGHRYLGAPKELALAEVLSALRPLLEDATFPKVGHDTKLVDVTLRRFGVHARGFVYDAMLASYLLDPEVPNDLASIAERDAGMKLASFDQIAPRQKGKPAPTLDDVTVEDATPYAAAFADAALRLSTKHVARLAEAGVSKVLSDLEMPLSTVLADLETIGVLVDTSRLGAIGETMAGELARLEAKAREVSGHPELNVGSPKQLEAILFDELGLKATKKTKTGRSTDAEALEAIADDHELPRVVLDHRAIAKLKGTYVDALPRLIDPKTGRIHGHWRQAVAATGRISSEDPNLQNIPIRSELGKEIRKAFVAPKGSVFLSADYSQIELRVLAHLSQDPVLCDAFRSGQDIHTRTAIEVFRVAPEDVTAEMRRRSKAINFGVIYGMGEVALAKRLHISRGEASRFIETYFERYRGVAKFMQKTMEEARKTERVRTLLGRIRILPDLRNSDRMKRAQAERIAQNTPIQGTAADILKLAMIRLAAPVVPGARMVLTVHDELDFEIPEAHAEKAAGLIKEAMETVVALDVPLSVDVGFGPSWADAH